MAAVAWRTVFRDNLFAGKVAIVTGGGTGIGKAITKELSRLGCRVVIASRKQEKLEEAAQEINHELRLGGAGGDHVSSERSSSHAQLVFPFVCNIRKEDQVTTYLNMMTCSMVVICKHLVSSFHCQAYFLKRKWLCNA